jgi:hypothetical protein
MPVILATTEAEISKIVVQSQPEQIVHETLSQKPIRKQGLQSFPTYRPWVQTLELQKKIYSLGRGA